MAGLETLTPRDRARSIFTEGVATADDTNATVFSLVPGAAAQSSSVATPAAMRASTVDGGSTSISPGMADDGPGVGRREDARRSRLLRSPGTRFRGEGEVTSELEAVRGKAEGVA